MTGASGVLGWHVCRVLDTDPTIEVVGLSREHRPEFRRIGIVTADLASPDAFRKATELGPFDVIVHTAAVTNPDECEKDRVRADRVNVEATRRLLDLIRADGRFIYTSTDLVFDGEGERYSESDLPNPVNYYGESKVRAEELGYPNSLIQSVAMKEVGLVARGSDCSLASDRCCREFSFSRSGVTEGLRKLRSELGG